MYAIFLSLSVCAFIYVCMYTHINYEFSRIVSQYTFMPLTFIGLKKKNEICIIKDIKI